MLSFPGAAESISRVWHHVVRIIQSMHLLCQHADKDPPATQKSPPLHILLPALWVGPARSSRGTPDPGEGRMQAKDDEALWLPACVGNLCGEGRRNLYTLGGLSGQP